MAETKQQRALRAVAEGRVRVMKANHQGIALMFRSERPDPDTLADVSYIVAVYLDDIGVARQCSCPNGEAHPVHPRCGHVWLAESMWRPGA